MNDTFMTIESPNSTTSVDLHRFILKTMDTNDLREQLDEHLIGMCANCASNMQGNKSGLAVILKASHPEITVTHCSAHRVELAFRDTFKEKQCSAVQTLYDESITSLMGLFNFYHKSSKQKQALMAALEATKSSRILPTRVGGTRWLAHISRAIEAFIKGYKAFVTQLCTVTFIPL